MSNSSKVSSNGIEIVPLQFDITRLREQFVSEILIHAPVVRSAAVSGWSLQSLDGSYQSGMETGFLPNNGPHNRGPAWVPRNETEAKLPTMQDFVRPSILCTGYFREILDRIDALGFHPRRARVLCLGAQSQSTWHVDGKPEVYSVRLHIPIITNPHCTFNYEDESFHMAADGNGYLVKVNRRHMIRNESTENRYHFVVNIWDQLGRTQHHRYQP